MNSFEQGLTRYLDRGWLDFARTVRIGVIGAGGLGSNALMHLVRSGFADLIVADPDLVEASNLNRQCFFAHQLGQPKVLALAENLRAVNPAVQIKTHVRRLDKDDLTDLFAPCRAVIEAVDEARTKKLVAETLPAPNRLVVCASGLGGAGRAGHMQVRWLGPNLAVVGDMATTCGTQAPPLSPGVGMAAAMQADVVLHHFLNIYTGVIS